MNKRQFLKTAAGLAGLLTTHISLSSFVSEARKKNSGNWKHRAWITPSENATDADIQARCKAYQNAGISLLYIEGDNEKYFRIAKQYRLETHLWLPTFLKNDKELLRTHPEWYTVNRKGESCAEKPAYVPYYRWLCPSRKEVQDYLDAEARKYYAKDYIDGYHLDYVRYCDVILPVSLWSKYGIVQNSELADYDYCYCEVCRSKCKSQNGFDPLELEYPDQSPTWRKYRYDSITNMVNRISDSAKEFHKPLTAAVFPTPEVAHRLVRQDWTRWNLDAVNPMIYHGFYREGIAWIGNAVAEGVHGLQGKFPLYAGLYLSDFKNSADLRQGILNALHNGAAGITLFNNPDDSALEVLRKTTEEAGR